MTPLPRWVLLAFLLAVVTSEPVDHACVQLCRIRNTSPEITGGCEYQQKLVLQYSGGRFPIQRLFRYCLTPCQGSSSTNTLFFDSQACRTFRDTLILRHGCSCDNSRDVPSENRQQDDRQVEKLEKNQLNKADRADIPKNTVNNEQTLSSVDKLSERTKTRQVFKDNMEMVEEDQLDENAGKGDTAVDKSGSMVRFSEESTIDWDQWCTAQCDNGQGGTACNCDIIP